MSDLTGWLLDVYPDETGSVVWLLAQDGQRRRLTHHFPVTFYAAGAFADLRRLWIVDPLKAKAAPAPNPEEHHAA